MGVGFRRVGLGVGVCGGASAGEVNVLVLMMDEELPDFSEVLSSQDGRGGGDADATSLSWGTSLGKLLLVWPSTYS